MSRLTRTHRSPTPPLICSALLLTAGSSHAQGIPVIDVANLVQTVQQVVNDGTKIKHQIEQIKQLQKQSASMSGSRKLGNVADNPKLHNYVPPNAFAQINALSGSGYSALNPTAKSLRDQGMVYNCQDRSGAARTDCQSNLAQPYQYKGLLQDAIRAASGRSAQIKSLMDQINATDDQKSVQEIQARIGAENAMLAHEMTQVQMLQGLAYSDERIARARDRERQYEALHRADKLQHYLKQ